jgi:21S rRNA (GM2251-2'-O)-methyltransferase
VRTPSRARTSRADSAKMLSHLAMRASLVTDLARLGRVSRPAHAPMRRVAAFASWRMGGGGDEGSDDAPPPARRRATTSAPQARKRFDDDDAYAEDYGNDGEAQTVGFAARRQGAGGRGGRGRGGGSRGNASRGNARGDRGRGRSFDERGDRYRPGFEDDDGFGGPTTRSVWQDRHDEKKRVREETGRSTLAETLVGEAVFGLNPVREALLAKRRQIHKVWVQEGADGILGDRQILSGCDALGLQITTVSKHDLNMLVNQGGGSGRPHNGVVIDASALEPVPIDSLPKWNPPSPSSEGKKKKNPPIWLALDEVVDPQNLGAILRTAKFLGVSGVVVCAKNSAPLSPVVSKGKGLSL